MKSLSEQIKACTRCPLSSQCKAPVPGINIEPGREGILFVGEAPGEREDRQGKPFVGPAGMVLKEHLLAKAGLHLDDFSMTNAVKCLPPLRKHDGKKDKTRKPLDGEVEACSLWLKAEIAQVQPQLIVALGDAACKALIPGFKSVLVQHGKFWPSPHGPVLAAVHPSACLHQPTMYTLFRQDMQVLGEAWGRGECKVVEDEFPEPFYNWGGSGRPVTRDTVSLDTEATTDDEAGDRLGNVPLSVQASWQIGKGFFYPAAGNYAHWKHELFEQIQTPLLCNEILIHNAMYDIPMLKKMGVDLTFHPGVQDSMIAAQVLQTEPAGLKALTLRHAGMRMRDYTEVIAPAQAELSSRYLMNVVRLAPKHGWWKPKVVRVIDPDTGEEKDYKPWAPAKNALKILEDVEGCDPVARWEDVVRRPEVEEVLGPMPRASLADVPFEEAKTYACGDSDGALRVWPHLKKQLHDMELWDVFRMDMDALPLVVMMEESGFGIDMDALVLADQKFADEMVLLESQLEKIAGRPVNPASPKQVSWLLFEHLKLPHNKKRGYETSTNDKLIEMMAHLHPVVKMVQDWREFSKLRSSYIRPIREKVAKAADGRLHARLKVTGTPTGRMTANDPNVLAIPARSKWGKMIKSAFTARPGCVIVNADFSQVELRIFAHETQEPSLIQDYLNGADLHRRTASLAYGIPQEDVTDAQRAHGKTLNFGIIYGIGPQGLAIQLGCSEAEARRFIDNYFRGYTKVRAWMDRVGNECRRAGFVRDMWGRIRHIGGVFSHDSGVASEALRQACNAKIQSAASGMIKRAMKLAIGLVTSERGKGWVCEPWVQVHDALVFEVSAERAEHFGKTLKTIMEGVRELSVPVKADVSYGPSWGEQKEKL